MLFKIQALYKENYFHTLTIIFNLLKLIILSCVSDVRFCVRVCVSIYVTNINIIRYVKVKWIEFFTSKWRFLNATGISSSWSQARLLEKVALYFDECVLCNIALYVAYFVSKFYVVLNLTLFSYVVTLLKFTIFSLLSLLISNLLSLFL